MISFKASWFTQWKQHPKFKSAILFQEKWSNTQLYLIYNCDIFQILENFLSSDSITDYFDHLKVTITPKNPYLVFASIRTCKVVYNEFEMPLMIGSDGEPADSYTLEPVCVLGTEISNSSNMQTLDFSFKAFKWSSSVSDSFIENQKIECTIKLTKNEPAHRTDNCEGLIYPLIINLKWKVYTVWGPI